jgi:acetolactate synthase-1/2/3 large subunit
MAKQTGAKFIAETIHDYGITHVFFVPAILLKALAEMEPLGITRVMAHGEKATAYMADGYARAARKPGVVFAQHIGGSNLAAGLRDAYLAGSPVFAVTGGPITATRYRHAYQDLEHFSQFDPTTKFNARVDDISRLSDIMQSGMRASVTGSPGPVHVEIRGHHAEITLAEAEFTRLDIRWSQVPPFRPSADPVAVENALKLLASAQRPMIVAGGGVAWSDARAEVVQLAEKLSIPVATSLNAKGTIVETHPLSVGVCGGYSRGCANQAVAAADVVMFIGSHTGGQVTTGWKIPRPGTKIIHIDIDAEEMGRNYPTEVALVGDARTVLQQMIAAVPKAETSAKAGRDAWLAQVQGLVADWRKSFDALLHSDAVPMRPERLCHEISQALPADGILVSDTGHSGIWTGALVDFLKPGQRMIRCAGSLGWALPGAIGVKCGAPASTVVAFAGDGGFYYHIAELETAARYGINIVMVVNNNSSLNQEIPLIDDAYGDKLTERSRELWGFREVNFAKVAENMGCVGIRVENPADLPAAFAKAFAAGRPVVLDVVTDYRAMAPKAWTGIAGASGH